MKQFDGQMVFPEKVAAILLACEQALAGYHPAYANLFIKKGAGADQNNPVAPLPLYDIKCALNFIRGKCVRVPY